MSSEARIGMLFISHYIVIMKLNIFILNLLFLTQICYSSFAQIKVSNFDKQIHYTKKNGLLSNRVDDILEDKKGFLWLANGNGITRFDGSSFTNYEYYYENETAYKIGFINSIVIDKSDEKLFIASEKGIFYTSINTISFKKLNSFSSSINSPIKRTNQILVKNQNILWATSYGDGLLKINIDSENHENFRFIDTSQTNKNQLNTIICITKDPINSNVLWLGTLAGLVRFNSVSKEYKVFVYNNNSELEHNRIRKIYVSNNEVYLGTWNKGLVVFNKHNRQFKLPLIRSHPEHTFISEFYKEKGPYLWITTNMGLLQYDIATNTIKNSIENSPAKGKIKGVSFVDSKGIIWFGYPKGMFKYNPSQSQHKFIQLEERNNLQNALLIKSIIPFNDFIYVLGHNGSGLYKINATNYSFETIKIKQSNNPERTNRNLRDMVKMDDENLLILSFNKLYIFNTRTQKFHLSRLQINHSSPSLQRIVKDKNNRYWVGGRVSGLTSLDFVNNTIKNYKGEFNVYKKGNHIWINELYIDNSNKLWIAKGSSTVMDLDNSKLSLLNPNNSVPFYQDVNGFLEDNKGRVWAASDNNGLGYINFKDFKKGVSHQIDGSFKGIYKHNDSIMWTTGNGLLGEFNTNTNAHKIIRLNNNSQYVRGPIISDENSKYIIGCLNGIIIYNPESQLINHETPKPYIRNITGNGNIYYEESSLLNKNLSFKSGTNNLVIEVSALGFQQPEQITYSYKIQEDWLSLGASQEINITNLTQGKYNFKIKACNEIGACSETTYNFTILTPWYRSWVAYMLYGILILTIVWLLYRFNLDKKLAVAERQKAIEFNDLKTKMYANISHEFRTPLTIISGLSTELLEDNKNDTQRNLLKGITYSNNQLLNLVNQMLDLSSLDAKKMIPSYKNGNVIIFIQKCVSIFKSYTDSKQLTLKFKSDVSNLTMDFDDDKLQKILNNLLSNAIKFTPEKGEIDVHLKQIKNQLRIIVSDTGIGIEKKEFSQIFERYYKTYDLKQNIGTGIGLALTKELVKLLQGSISMDSKVGIGTTFKIDLPIQNTAIKADTFHKISFIDYDENHVSQIKNSNEEKTPNTILLVEDNKEIRNFIKLILGDLYTIYTANNGVKGLKIANNKHIDFIISDVMMPEMDGFEFCKHIKKDINTSHIPFVIISARTETKDKVEAYKLGVDAYLIKPFNKQELLLIIKNLLEKKQKQISFLSNLLHLKNNHKEVLDINELDLNLVKNIQEVALDNNKQMSIEELAQSLYTSRSQLHKKVKSLTGMSITNYMNHIRIEKAKGLLKTTQLTISEIAYDVGFASSNYFSRSFKKITNTSPVSYRQRHV